MTNARKYSGVISNLRITRSRGVPMGTCTISGGDGKFSMEVMTFGQRNVDKLKAAGNGRTLWVQGDFVKSTKTNAVGGTYQEDAFKAVNLKDITPEPKVEAEGEAAVEDAAVDTGADVAEVAAEAEGVTADETVAETAEAENDSEVPF